MTTRLALLFAAGFAPVAALADTVVAARTIRANAVLENEDVALQIDSVAGALDDIEDALGLEARRMIYAGRPIRAEDLGPPAIVERNQAVTLRYTSGGLEITTEGRAMGRAAVGETVRAVNIASRITVTGRVAADGSVFVAGSSR